LLLHENLKLCLLFLLCLILSLLYFLLFLCLNLLSILSVLLGLFLHFASVHLSKPLIVFRFASLLFGCSYFLSRFFLLFLLLFAIFPCLLYLWLNFLNSEFILLVPFLLLFFLFLNYFKLFLHGIILNRNSCVE